jgi:hypothetical protein
MKRFVFLVMSVLFLALVCVPAFGQDVGGDSAIPAYAGMKYGFETFAALVAVSPVIAEILKKTVFKSSSSLVNQIISWIVGLLVTFAVWGFGWGFLAGMEWWLVLLYGLGASLAANGIFDTGIITGILGVFGKKK